jgi:hypothetical protein
MCSPRGVLDLPPVHIPPRQVLDLLRREIRTDLFEEGRPDLLLGLLSELLKVKSDVNTGQKGLVECFDSVRGKEHDPTIVFKVTAAVSDAFSKRRKRQHEKSLTRPQPWHSARDHGASTVRGIRPRRRLESFVEFVEHISRSGTTALLNILGTAAERKINERTRETAQKAEDMQERMHGLEARSVAC